MFAFNPQAIFREGKSDGTHPATSNYAKEGNNMLFLIQRRKITIDSIFLSRK
jgi:hypothetical protein